MEKGEAGRTAQELLHTAGHSGSPVFKDHHLDNRFCASAKQTRKP